MIIKNKSLPHRGLILLIGFFAVSLLLIIRLFFLQVLGHEDARKHVIDNVQQTTTVPAKRGIIYDRNMDVLATDLTTWRVFISPVDMVDDEMRELVANGLSEILGVDKAEILAKSKKLGRKDETIKQHVMEEEAVKVREFIKKYNLTTQIHLQQTYKRYYPYKTLASHVIGAMGTDKGLFGLEDKYDTYLKGTPGVYITAKNAKSQNMPYKYDKYVEAVNGLSLVTTIDVNLQRMLETQLEITYKENKVRNRVAGVVMDVNTGAILAMATYPSFDLNSPYVLDKDSQAKLDNSGLIKGTDKYNEYFWELVYSMWNNKVVTDLYEPGSTFKIVTSAMALEENVITFDTKFTCGGSHVVGGRTIRCHKTTGHGTQPFRIMLQQSCNVALMKVGELVGADRFFKYFTEFGYTHKTDVDLPGEAVGIYHQKEALKSVELATSSFGQTFKTTAIQQIAAVSTIANGGKLVKPHIVSALVDENNNVVVSFENLNKGHVISEQVSKSIAEVLEQGVSSDGGSRNAYVPGFRIAAKTGTSEKRDKINPVTGEKDLRVGSCVAFAPAEDAKIAILIMVDEPNAGVNYGAVVAAPYIAAFMEEALPYLGIEPVYSEQELEKIMTSVSNYVGMTVSQAKSKIASQGIQYKVIGNGTKVVSQLPQAGEVMKKGSGTIVLYTGNETPEQNLKTVPNVVNYSVAAAIQSLVNEGFNVNISGSLNYNAGEGAKVISQSIPKGTQVPEGTIITIVCRHLDVTDE